MFIQFTGRVEYIPNDLEIIALPASPRYPQQHPNTKKIKVLPAGNRPEITLSLASASPIFTSFQGFPNKATDRLYVTNHIKTNAWSHNNNGHFLLVLPYDT